MKEKVVVISVDAMVTSDVAVLEAMPELAPVFSRKAEVRRMLGPYPTLTYPCHATMVTGCWPMRHGILNNDLFLPGVENPDWHWFSRDTKVPDLLMYAKRAGLSTAVVSWPGMAGNSNADHLVAKIYMPDTIADSAANSASVSNIYDRYRHMLEGHRTRNIDEFTALCTRDIIREFQPDLLLTYFALIDSERHKKGAATELHRDALEETGRRIASIVEAVRETGSLGDTTFVLMSDHGQIDTKAVFNLNAELVRRGYITLDGEGRPACWRIYGHSAAFTNEIHVRDMDEEEAYTVLCDIMAEYPEYLDRILTRYEMERIYHSAGDFSFMMEGVTGVSFGRGLQTPVVQKEGDGDYKTAKATHGHAPEKGMKPPFLVLGKRAGDGTVIEEASLVDAAPTILSIFGIGMDGADGSVLPGMVEREEK